MKRLSKILSALLLIALALSAFGVFSVFAADATALTPTVIYDMDSKASLAFANKATVTRDGEKVTSPSATKKTDANGETYWLLETNVAEGAKIGNGSGAYIQMTPSSNPVIMSGGTKGDKNTDFMVIDFDVATDSEFIDYLQFHMRYGNAKGATSQDKANGYPQVRGNGYDDLYFSMSTNTEYTTYPTVEPSNKWVNVTYVYDFRGETQADWKCYAYVDGYFVGEMATTATDSYYYMWLRFSLPKTALENYGETKIRNLTYTAYPIGWDGDLANTALGKAGVSAYDIDDLAYTFDGTNSARNSLIASVMRDGVKTNIYKFSDLDANFVDGDVVTLYRDIGTPILVNANNVTFKDNGYDYSLVDTSKVDFSTAKYVVLNRVTRVISSSGDATAFANLNMKNSKGTGTVGDGDIVVMLDSLTRTYSPSSTGDDINENYHITFDINGHELTLASTKRAFNTAASGVVLRFTNGDLVYAGATDLTMPSANSSVVFENVDFVVKNGTLVDQRNGLVVVKDSYVTAPNYGTASKPAYSTFTSLKGNGSVYSAFHVNNSKFDCVMSPITIANTSSSKLTSGGGRQGGLNTIVRVFNGSEIIATAEDVFTVELSANQTGISLDADGNFVTANANYAKNDFNVDIVVKDSKVSTSKYFTLVDLKTLTHNYIKIDGTVQKVTGDQIYKANGLSADVNIYIDNAEIECSHLLSQANSAGDSTEVEFEFDVSVSVDKNTKINASDSIIYNSSAHESVTTSFTLADGAMLSTDKIDSASSKQEAEVILGDKSVIAHSSLAEGYGYIATSVYRECYYNINNYNNTETYQSGTFLWNSTANIGDPVDMSAVIELPEATTEYMYTDWTSDNSSRVYTTKLTPSFKMAANLTALTDFHLNVYLPTTVDTDKITVNVNGNDITEFEIINIGGVDYLASESAIIRGISPEDVATTYPVTVTIEGGMGETMTLNSVISLEKYLTSALKTASSEEAKNFVQSIINYVVAATNYGEGSRAPTALKLLATSVDAPQYRGAKWTGPEGVSAALNLGDSVRWVFTVKEDTTYTFTYAGVTRKFTADENGQITIGLRAVDMLGDITITDDTTGDSGTLNLAGYYRNVTDFEAKAVINALYYYSVAASAYAEE